MKFNFKAKTKEGDVREGLIEATDREAAVEVLQKNNLLPIFINEQAKQADLEKAILKYYDRVTSKELMIFFRQLAILIETRVPIVSSLTAINAQNPNRYFNKVLKEVISDIEGGLSFSRALEKHRDVFSELAISIIRAGEASGNLKKSVDYVADNIERNYTVASRVRNAMIYPAIVLFVFFIIGFLTISFIIPKLTAIIKDLNAEVPWYTKAVMSIGAFMEQYWWAVLVIILGFCGGLVYYLQTQDGKKEWDHIKIRLPIIGPIFRGVYITRFSENLAVLLTGGIPIMRSLTIVSSVIGNVVYEAIFLRAAEEVRRGGNMSDVFKKTNLIPPVVTHMVKIGEESGQIDSVLSHVARFYDQETELKTKTLASLIEPVLIIIIGLSIGFLTVAILMPIYDVASRFR